MKPLPRLESPESLNAEVKKIRDVDRAWAAGFYDGEGCTSIHTHQNGNIYIRMAVGNTRLDNLERLQSIIGGKIYEQGKRNENWKEVWLLSISAKGDIFIAFWVMFPWLSTQKIEQFNRVFNKVREQRRAKVLSGSKPSTALWPTVKI